MLKVYGASQTDSFGASANNSAPEINILDATKLLGGSNRCVIKLDSTEYILRLTKQHKLILTK
jgi:hemin uptake protein HemP